MSSSEESRYFSHIYDAFSSTKSISQDTHTNNYHHNQHNRSDKGGIVSSMFMKMCKEAQLLNQTTFRKEDADLLFTKLKPSHGYKLNKSLFKEALHQISDVLNMDYGMLLETIILSQRMHDQPIHSGSRLYEDKTSYTGVFAGRRGGPPTIVDTRAKLGLSHIVDRGRKSVPVPGIHGNEHNSLQPNGAMNKTAPTKTLGKPRGSAIDSFTNTNDNPGSQYYHQQGLQTYPVPQSATDYDNRDPFSMPGQSFSPALFQAAIRAGRPISGLGADTRPTQLDYSDPRSGREGPYLINSNDRAVVLEPPNRQSQQSGVVPGNHTLTANKAADVVASHVPSNLSSAKPAHPLAALIAAKAASAVGEGTTNTQSHVQPWMAELARRKALGLVSSEKKEPETDHSHAPYVQGILEQQQLLAKQISIGKTSKESVATESTEGTGHDKPNAAANEILQVRAKLLPTAPPPPPPPPRPPPPPSPQVSTLKVVSSTSEASMNPSKSDVEAKPPEGFRPSPDPRIIDPGPPQDTTPRTSQIGTSKTDALRARFEHPNAKVLGEGQKYFDARHQVSQHLTVSEHDVHPPQLIPNVATNRWQESQPVMSNVPQSNPTLSRSLDVNHMRYQNQSANSQSIKPSALSSNNHHVSNLKTRQMSGPLMQMGLPPNLGVQMAHMPGPFMQMGIPPNLAIPPMTPGYPIPAHHPQWTWPHAHPMHPETYLYNNPSGHFLVPQRHDFHREQIIGHSIGRDHPIHSDLDTAPSAYYYQYELESTSSPQYPGSVGLGTGSTIPVETQSPYQNPLRSRLQSSTFSFGEDSRGLINTIYQADAKQDELQRPGVMSNSRKKQSMASTSEIKPAPVARWTLSEYASKSPQSQKSIEQPSIGKLNSLSASSSDQMKMSRRLFYPEFEQKSEAHQVVDITIEEIKMRPTEELDLLLHASFYVICNGVFGDTALQLPDVKFRVVDRQDFHAIASDSLTALKQTVDILDVLVPWLSNIPTSTTNKQRLQQLQRVREHGQSFFNSRSLRRTEIPVVESTRLTEILSLKACINLCKLCEFAKDPEKLSTAGDKVKLTVVDIARIYASNHDLNDTSYSKAAGMHSNATAITFRIFRDHILVSLSKLIGVSLSQIKLSVITHTIRAMNGLMEPDLPVMNFGMMWSESSSDNISSDHSSVGEYSQYSEDSCLEQRDDDDSERSYRDDEARDDEARYSGNADEPAKVTEPQVNYRESPLSVDSDYDDYCLQNEYSGEIESKSTKANAETDVEVQFVSLTANSITQEARVADTVEPSAMEIISSHPPNAAIMHKEIVFDDFGAQPKALETDFGIPYESAPNKPTVVINAPIKTFSNPLLQRLKPVVTQNPAGELPISSHASTAKATADNILDDVDKSIGSDDDDFFTNSLMPSVSAYTAQRQTTNVPAKAIFSVTASLPTTTVGDDPHWGRALPSNSPRSISNNADFVAFSKFSHPSEAMPEQPSLIIASKQPVVKTFSSIETVGPVASSLVEAAVPIEVFKAAVPSGNEESIAKSPVKTSMTITFGRPVANLPEKTDITVEPSRPSFKSLPETVAPPVSSETVVKSPVRSDKTAESRVPITKSPVMFVVPTAPSGNALKSPLATATAKQSGGHIATECKPIVASVSYSSKSVRTQNQLVTADPQGTTSAPSGRRPSMFAKLIAKKASAAAKESYPIKEKSPEKISIATLLFPGSVDHDEQDEDSYDDERIPSFPVTADDVGSDASSGPPMLVSDSDADSVVDDHDEIQTSSVINLLTEEEDTPSSKAISTKPHPQDSKENKSGRSNWWDKFRIFTRLKAGSHAVIKQSRRESLTKDNDHSSNAVAKTSIDEISDQPQQLDSDILSEEYESAVPSEPITVYTKHQPKLPKPLIPLISRKLSTVQEGSDEDDEVGNGTEEDDIHEHEPETMELSINIKSSSTMPKGEWIEKLHAKSNRKYWKNTVTNETTWNDPTVNHENRASGVPDNQSSTIIDKVDLKESVSSEWEEKFNVKLQRMYWKNTRSGETSWKPPATATVTAISSTPASVNQENSVPGTKVDVVDKAPVSDSKEAIAHWIEKFHAKTNRKFWKNELTGETRWKPPMETDNSIVKDTHVESIPQSLPATVPTLADVPIGGDWIEHHSKSHNGRSFWKHSVTGEVTWKNPHKPVIDLAKPPKPTKPTKSAKVVKFEESIAPEPPISDIIENKPPPIEHIVFSPVKKGRSTGSEHHDDSSVSSLSEEDDKEESDGKSKADIVHVVASILPPAAPLSPVPPRPPPPPPPSKPPPPPTLPPSRSIILAVPSAPEVPQKPTPKQRSASFAAAASLVSSTLATSLTLGDKVPTSEASKSERSENVPTVGAAAPVDVVLTKASIKAKRRTSTRMNFSQWQSELDDAM